MSLKTATLIALIGVGVYFCLSVPSVFFGVHLYRISMYLGQAFALFRSILFSGSILLFLAVFYAKQKE